jgi:ABC-type sugar transport system substrate-binding protein
MKGLKTLSAVLPTVALLLAATAPASAQAAAYKHYVACGVSQNATPSHACPAASKKGAFFKSVQADVFYTVCVKFPTGKNLCAKAQEATMGTLYVNKVTSNIPGKHRVSWFVEGKQVGLFAFDVIAKK